MNYKIKNNSPILTLELAKKVWKAEMFPVYQKIEVNLKLLCFMNTL
jgi:hypothetical protein